MRAVDVFLRQIDDGWEHAWESLVPTLSGITEAEAAWQAPCYRDEPAQPGLPPPGTIHGQIHHMAECTRYYTAQLENRGPGGEQAENSRVEPLPLASFPETWKRLQEIHGTRRELVASLPDADLDLRVRNGMTVAEYLTGTIRHDIWHAAQIAVARRLWRVSHPS